MHKILSSLVIATLAASLAASAMAQSSQPIVAVFAHPDDERVIGPLLSRLAREGRETHLVIATDGSQGVRDFAKIPAGAELAAVRAKEAQCAATRLGVRQLHMLGLPDGGLASVNGMTEALLTVRVPFEESDLTAGREEFACHRTQYAPAEMDSVNKYLAYAWNGTVWLRPWTGTLRHPGLFTR